MFLVHVSLICQANVHLFCLLRCAFVFFVLQFIFFVLHYVVNVSFCYCVFLYNAFFRYIRRFLSSSLCLMLNVLNDER